MAYGSTQLPYNYAKNAGDPTLDNVNPPQQGGSTVNQPGQANQQPRPQVSAPASAPQVQPQQTFAQMQAGGYARPPMPAPTQAPNATAPNAPPPSTVSAAPNGGLPSGFTLGGAGTADWGRSYYNGASVSGLEPMKDGSYQVYMNDPNGQYQGQRQQISAADAAALKAAQQANYYGPNQGTSTSITDGSIMPSTQSGATGVTPQQTMGLSGQQASAGPSFSTNAGQMSIAPSGGMPAGNVGLPFGGYSVNPNTGQIVDSQGNNVGSPNQSATPPTSAPQGYDILGALTGGAQGGGAGSQLQGATNQAALNQLNNPSPYGSDQVKALYNWLGGNIQDQYTQGQRAIGENMARRGLGTSTIHAGALNDLNIGQRSAQESMAQNLAQNYAQTLGQYQANAIGQGNQVGTQGQQNQQSWLNQLMGYGQQGFQNDLATNAQNQNANDSYRNYILGLLQYGQGG